ncbi:MAG: nucleotide exchange factor GrpE [Actinobacteria bacterium]|nr:nucleotide exchange factor GrpE [Actinomycetota bacterium]
MTDRKHTKHDRKRGKTAEAAAAKAAQRTEASTQTEDATEDAQAAETAAPDAQAAEDQTSEAAAPTIADELAAVTRERDDYLDHLRRLKAEWDNYRKRVQRDNEELRLRAAETVVESLLPVMDNFSRALEAADKHEEGQLLAGLNLVAEQLRGTLAGHGLEEIEVKPGTTFDPEYHEAIVAQESDEYDEGTVTEVLERGYLLHGKLLRPAKVIVAR